MKTKAAQALPIKSLFVVMSAIVSVLVLAFTALLNIASFNQNYAQSINNGYAVVANEAVQKLEYSIKYGKPLGNFYGIEQILDTIHKEVPAIQEVDIALPNGSIVYNQSGKVTDAVIPSGLLNQLNFQKSTQADDSIALPDRSNEDVFLPIRGADGKVAGVLVLTYDRSTIAATTGQYEQALLRDLVIVATIALAALIAFVLTTSLYDKAGALRARTILTFLISLLSALQIVYGVLNYQLFHGAYRQLTNNSTRLTAVMIQHDITAVIAKGVSYNDLYDINAYLSTTKAAIPQVGSISVVSQTGTRMYQASASPAATHAQAIGESIEKVPLATDQNGTSASLQVSVSSAYLRQKTQNLILDAATVLLTSILFMIEVTLVMLYFFRRRLDRTALPAESNPAETSQTFLVRPLTFLMSAAVFMSATFIPVVTKSLYHPFLHLPPNLIIALPNSADSLLGAIATILASTAMERYGWRSVFAIGLSVLTVGAILSAVSGQEFAFVLARGIAGAGYGAGLVAVRAFVNSAASATERTAGVSGLYAGLYGGMNFGSTVGAMLADRIGYASVFAIASGVAILALVLTILLIRGRETGPAATAHVVSTPGPAPTRSFFRNREVLGFFVLILLPTAVCGTFLSYFFPLFAQSSGLSESNVGRAFLLNGICIVYLGPVLSRWFLRSLGVKKSLIGGITAITAAMILFALHANILTGFTVVILLGIADGFGLVAQNNYYVGLSAARGIGTGRALGYQGNVRKVGQMMGPIIFASLAGLGYHIGFAAIGLVMAAFILVFLWNSRREPESYVKG